MRERLMAETHLFVAAQDSAGTITAQRRLTTGWAEGLVKLQIEGGELVANTDGDGNLVINALEIAFQAVTIPPSVLGREARLTDLHLRLTAPTHAMSTWDGDADARAIAPLDLELSWSLAFDDTQLPLGMPRLPLLPANLHFAGDGVRIAAEIRVHAPGELWNWADLVKLSDLELALGAQTLVL